MDAASPKRRACSEDSTHGGESMCIDRYFCVSSILWKSAPGTKSCLCFPAYTEDYEHPDTINRRKSRVRIKGGGIKIADVLHFDHAPSGETF